MQDGFRFTFVTSVYYLIYYSNYLIIFSGVQEKFYYLEKVSTMLILCVLAIFGIFSSPTKDHMQSSASPFLIDALLQHNSLLPDTVSPTNISIYNVRFIFLAHVLKKADA